MNKVLVLYLFLLLTALHGKAQISHGGRPLPLSTLRNTDGQMYREMPSFDIEEVLRLDSLNESDLRGGYNFAYKFMTDFNRSNSGTSFVLPDGTRIWRLGIRSRNAYSINVLFSEYELPEGAQLFLYNADQSHVLGAFNHLNNSDSGLLPVAPVDGDELIIEYQEPAKAAFPGRLTVGEVNHGYRNLRGLEPGGTLFSLSCMPPLACYQNDGEPHGVWGRSVVLMLIDGRTMCTGTLINNTAQDGKPYLLTASHCLNGQFSMINPDYGKIASSIVCFFNYNSPLCDNVLRGTEEMSVASATCRAVNEHVDMALLELNEIPPAYYQPYYAGWDVKDAGMQPYTGIHHPQGSVKRVNICNEEIALASLSIQEADFMKNAHWRVKRWNVGSTAGGSSGSPLLDAKGHIIGALSGGASVCEVPENDYYYALQQAWQPDQKADKQLKYWLNPSGRSEQLVCEGFDLYASAPCLRLSNVYASGIAETVETAVLPATNNEPLFGNNSLGLTEYAEGYQANGEALLQGAYFVTPSVNDKYGNLKVEITVYSGSVKPEILLHTELFQPKYCNKVSFDNTFQETIKPLSRAQESFIRFPEPVKVKGTFYVGYRITAPAGVTFSVFNLPQGQTVRNTAWINAKGNWIEASAFPQKSLSTSLFIDPVIQYVTNTGMEEPKTGSPVRLIVGAGRQTLNVILPENIDNARVALLTIDGKIMFDIQVKNNETMLPVSSYAPGVYLVRISYQNSRYTEKVLL